MPTVSIITPTYNRADLLPRCYESLRNQTCKDFEWLVIDDGSTDNTSAVIERFRQIEEAFPIRYEWKSNGGKHTALNRSHSIIRGRFCLVLDSDDILIPTAIEEIILAWGKWELDKDIGRIIFLKADISDPNRVICYVEHENVPVDSLKERRIGNAGRDCCDTFRTELFTKYRFPEFPNEKFIGEGSGWFPIELESKAVYINKAIYLCEYQENGLTAAGRKMRIENPLGGMYNSKTYMNPKLPLRTRLKKSILYACYSRFADLRFLTAIHENPYKLLTIFGWLPGNLLFLFWKKKYSEGVRK